MRDLGGSLMEGLEQSKTLSLTNLAAYLTGGAIGFNPELQFRNQTRALLKAFTSTSKALSTLDPEGAAGVSGAHPRGVRKPGQATAAGARSAKTAIRRKLVRFHSSNSLASTLNTITTVIHVFYSCCCLSYTVISSKYQVAHKRFECPPKHKNLMTVTNRFCGSDSKNVKYKKKTDLHGYVSARASRLNVFWL